MDHNEMMFFPNGKSVFKAQWNTPAAELHPTGEIVETKSLPLAPLGGLGKQRGLASQHGERLEQMGRENGCFCEKEMTEPEYLIPEASM